MKMDDGFILQPTGICNSVHTHTHVTLKMYSFSEIGRLMARYFVAFESMKRFLGLKGNETLADLVSACIHHNIITYLDDCEHTCAVVCYGTVSFVLLQVRELSLCQEFADVRLRVSEKRILNSLNKDKNKPSIR